MMSEMKKLNQEAIEIMEDTIAVDDQLIDQISKFAYKNFGQWNWKSKFKTKDKAIEFLLSHLENNRQLWVLTLKHNRSLANQIRIEKLIRQKEYYNGTRKSKDRKPKESRRK